MELTKLVFDNGPRVSLKMSTDGLEELGEVVGAKETKGIFLYLCERDPPLVDEGLKVFIVINSYGSTGHTLGSRYNRPSLRSSSHFGQGWLYQIRVGRVSVLGDKELIELSEREETIRSSRQILMLILDKRCLIERRFVDVPPTRDARDAE